MSTVPDIGLEVQGFGPLRQVALKFKKITVLTGPNASGKSVAAKLLFLLCERFFSRGIAALINPPYQFDQSGFVQDWSMDGHHGMKPHWEMTAHDSLYRWFGHSGYGFNHRIKFSRNKAGQESFIELEAKKDLTNVETKTIRFSRDLIEIMNFFDKESYAKSQDFNLPMAERQRYREASLQSRNECLNTLHTQFGFRGSDSGVFSSYYIPAIRIGFDSPNFRQDKESGGGLGDPELEAFDQKVIRYVSESKMDDFKDLGEACQLACKILGASYEYEPSSRDFMLALKDGNRIKLRHASSGQKSVVWVLMLVLRLIRENTPITLIIEEPEAHLLPETQILLIRFLTYFVQVNPHHRLVVVTHSPYVLSQLNNCLYAHQQGQKSSIEQPSIAVEDTSAFWFDEDDVENVIRDQKMHRIAYHQHVDSASRILHEKFEKIFNQNISNPAQD